MISYWRIAPQFRFLPMIVFLRQRKRRHILIAAIAQLGERQTEDLEVPGSIPGFGILSSRAKPLFHIISHSCIFGKEKTSRLNKRKRRAHPESNQGPADLQSAALTAELYTRTVSELYGHCDT